MQKQPGAAQARFAEHLREMLRETEVRRAAIHERAVRVEALRERLHERMDAGRTAAASATSPPLDLGLRDALSVLARLRADAAGALSGGRA